ncbi:MAG: hypothetical protein ACYDBJ_21265 [Aggregatilineales bacterium]
MLGYAEFKSHVLKRDEKGVFGIPFKRLLGCGLGAGGLFTGLRVAVPDVAFIAGAVGFVALLIFTAPHGGIARWKHVLYGVRWQLLTAAALAPKSVTGKFAQALGVPGEGIDIDADSLFRAEDDTPRTNLSDWVSFTRPLSPLDKLSLDIAPGLALHGETP